MVGVPEGGWSTWGGGGEGGGVRVPEDCWSTDKGGLSTRGLEYLMGSLEYLIGLLRT